MSQNNQQRNYEATFILDTRTYQEPVETLIDKIKGTINSIQGSIHTVENQGQKTFSRAVDRKFPAGIYVRFEVSAPSNFPKTLKERFKLERLVNRIMITTAQ